MKKLLPLLFCLSVLFSCVEQERYEQDGSVNKGTEPEEFPIVAWTGIDFNHLSWFKHLKASGCNVYLGWYRNTDEVLRALDAAELAGIRMIVRTEGFTEASSKERRAEVEAIKDHHALYMYHVTDEPWDDDFGWVADAVSDIRAVDKEHQWYVNLYPNWAWGGAEGYRAKVEAYCKAMPENPPFLSFDNYPVTKDGLRPDWYSNLEDIRAVASARKIPFWGFALALGHNLDGTDNRPYFYPIPTLAELRLQQFSNLAYGASGFQYFTFWGMYHDDGPTEVYDRVRKVNEELQGLSKYFYGATVENVWHTGNSVPAGTRKLVAMPEGVTSLSVSSEGAVVSSFSKGTHRYLALVNKDYRNLMTLDISFSSPARKMDKYGNAGDTLQKINEEVGPGDIIIFELS